MIKANKGMVKLDGKTYQLLEELGTIVNGIYYTMTEKQAAAPKDARRMIGKAVKMGLNISPDDVVDAEKTEQYIEPELVKLLEQIMDFLEDEEAEDADDYD